jgi:hypothetical protein
MFIITIFYIVIVLLIGFLVMGELIASDSPDGSFCKWWRKNIIKDSEKKS